eukprot:7429567-Heterocapsa_arctica.AAC.1
MNHVKRDYDSTRCPPDHDYSISPAVMAWIREQSDEVKQALSQTGNLGAVRNMNAILTTRLHDAIKAVEGWTRGKGGGKTMATVSPKGAS